MFSYITARTSYNRWDDNDSRFLIDQYAELYLHNGCRGGYRGGGGHPARAPLKLEKIRFFGIKSWFFTRNTPKILRLPPQLERIWFFGVKSWFFTRNTPTNFAPPSARLNLFKFAPPNLKSGIRPWVAHYTTVLG